MTTCVLETLVYVHNAVHAGLISTEFNDAVELVQNVKEHWERSLDPSFDFNEDEKETVTRLFDILEREIYFYVYGGEIGLWRSISVENDSIGKVKLELRVRPK